MREHLRQSRPDLVSQNQPPVQQTYNPKLSLHSRKTQDELAEHDRINQQFKDRMAEHKAEEDQKRTERKAKKGQTGVIADPGDVNEAGISEEENEHRKQAAEKRAQGYSKIDATLADLRQRQLGSPGHTKALPAPKEEP